MASRVLRFSLLCLVVGCSGSSLTTDSGTSADTKNADTKSTDGTNADSTSVDSTSADGTTDQSKVATCETISTDYETALLKAEECTLGAPGQCTQTGIASFFCECHVVVNGDTANLAAISARFDAAGCLHGCIGLCADETAASCQPDSTSSTGGRCLRVQSDGGT